MKFEYVSTSKLKFLSFGIDRGQNDIQKLIDDEGLN
jgi:hypothetical protein